MERKISSAPSVRPFDLTTIKVKGLLLSEDGSRLFLRGQLDNSHIGLVSGTSSAAVLGTKLTLADAPMVVFQPSVYDQMGMTGPVEGTNFGFSDATDIDLVFSTHPIAKAAQTSVHFSSLATIAFGEIGGDGRAIATEQSGKPVMMGYAGGDNLANGQQAPDARVGFPGYRSSFDRIGIEGWVLFESAIRWAIVDSSRWLWNTVRDRRQRRRVVRGISLEECSVKFRMLSLRAPRMRGLSRGDESYRDIR
jgi:hypothetical protein